MKELNVGPEVRLLRIQMAQMGDLMSQSEAARLLCCERQNVFNYIKRGTLTPIPFAGRKVVARAEVLKILARRREKPDYQQKVAVFAAKHGRSEVERQRGKDLGEAAKKKRAEERLKKALKALVKSRPGETNITI